nr:Diphthamide synthesis domain containing protein [Haemonchus contortus]CDJ96993.1 Diphthamide synthesis domain containing protein [Haemonchus contortus]
MTPSTYPCIRLGWVKLRRRLFLIEKLRDAATVGLVVGSVAVQGHAKAVKRMRNMCKASGKKLYVISVGKVNVPKLSNFAEVDVFVLLSCPFGIIFDSSSFLRPVLSMFEAEIALNPSKTWFADGGWCADLTQFVNDSVGIIEDEGADVSLVTGRVRRLKLSVDGKTAEARQVLPYNPGEYFKNSSWRGLDDSVRLEESTDIQKGRLGIALEYDTELASRTKRHGRKEGNYK